MESAVLAGSNAFLSVWIILIVLLSFSIIGTLVLSFIKYPPLRKPKEEKLPDAKDDTIKVKCADCGWEGEVYRRRKKCSKCGSDNFIYD